MPPAHTAQGRDLGAGLVADDDGASARHGRSQFYSDGPLAGETERIEHDAGLGRRRRCGHALAGAGGGSDVRRHVAHGRRPDVVGELPSLSPTRQEVEVDLVGPRAGDPIVVSIVNELTPGLVRGAARVAMTQGQRHARQFLAFHEGGLGSTVGLLDVDVADVLAGIDRAHFAGLWRWGLSFFGQLSAHGGEELLR